jgi:hypothetical protein
MATHNNVELPCTCDLRDLSRDLTDAAIFYQTGTRMITCEADKSIKVWKEDENATQETHPIDWKAAAPGSEKRW